MLGKDQLIKGMWEYLFLERARVKKFPKDAEKEKSRKGYKPKNFWIKLKKSADTDCTPQNDEMWILCLKKTEVEEFSRSKKERRNGPSKEHARPLQKWQKVKRES